MEFNDLLAKALIDPKDVIMMRHSPIEVRLKQILGRLALDRPDLYTAYQSTHKLRTEKSVIGSKYLASFIGHKTGTALFVSLYRIDGTREILMDDYWDVPEHDELRRDFGFAGLGDDLQQRPTIAYFDLVVTDFCADWRGKLVIGWPPPDISWFRLAHRNHMPILTIFEQSQLKIDLPKWDEIILSSADIDCMPLNWEIAMSQWRAIYLIFDGSDGKSYVGSASGSSNLLGRWRDYSLTGHGGNKWLKGRNLSDFRFSILQRLSPDTETEEVVKIENNWKRRLHTIYPEGLNDN